MLSGKLERKSTLAQVSHKYLESKSGTHIPLYPSSKYSICVYAYYDLLIKSVTCGTQFLSDTPGQV